jgi:ADP-ribosyl-[dinitrogen reductase] hydrolase
MTEDQALGSIIGLAVGDALGTTLEFGRNPSPDRTTWHTDIVGGGPFEMPVGGWTDDTSMALALMESYLDAGKFDPELAGDYFVQWWRDGAFSHNGVCFDIGMTTREALGRFENRRKGASPYVGGAYDWDSGNGGIMRLAPSVVANHTNLDAAVRDAKLQSSITHQSRECLLYAGLMARVLWHGNPFIKDVEDYVLPDSTDWSDLLSGGYVKETWQCAMWCVRNTSSFKEALIHAVNRRYDADTVGAVTGQIAGAIYGLSGIPDRWLEKLAWRHEIETKAIQLFKQGAIDCCESVISAERG